MGGQWKGVKFLYLFMSHSETVTGRETDFFGGAEKKPAG